MKKKVPKWLSTLLLVFIFVAGLSLLLYPTISDWWNSLHQSRAIVDYEAAAAALTPEDYTQYFAAAEAYNEHLRATAYPLTDYEALSDEYNEALNPQGNGIIGYIHIDAIDVEIPLYHGTSEAVLNTAAGHLEGSTLPIGGESTHAVISAHRGLPSAKLFTNLDKLVVGDTFYLVVLDRVLTYEIDQIRIVLPEEVDALTITEGEDYCTLLTCTPYGINTHRMLVRGTRIENPEEAESIRVTADAVQIRTILVALALGIPVLLILALIVFLRPKKKNVLKEAEAYVRTS